MDESRSSCRDSCHCFVAFADAAILKLSLSETKTTVPVRKWKWTTDRWPSVPLRIAIVQKRESQRVGCQSNDENAEEGATVHWHNQIAIGQRLEERRDGGQNGSGQMISLYSKKFDKEKKKWDRGAKKFRVPGRPAKRSSGS
jgi:hypothetical protein